MESPNFELICDEFSKGEGLRMLSAGWGFIFSQMWGLKISIQFTSSDSEQQDLLNMPSWPNWGWPKFYVPKGKKWLALDDQMIYLPLKSAVNIYTQAKYYSSWPLHGHS